MRKHICSFYPIELRILHLIIEEAHSHVIGIPADVWEFHGNLDDSLTLTPDEFGYVGMALSLDTLHHLDDLVEYVLGDSTNIRDRLRNHLRLVKKAEEAVKDE